MSRISSLITKIDPTSEHDLLCKVVILGNSNTGKTTLIKNFLDNRLYNDYVPTRPTSGVEFSTVLVKTPNICDLPQNSLKQASNNVNIKLHVWDCSGQDKYRYLLESFLHSACVVFLVYSVDCRSSFDNLKVWYETAAKKSFAQNLNSLTGEESNKDKHVYYVVANKVDTSSREAHHVTYQEGKKFADSIDADYVETSAKTGKNVYYLWTSVCLDALTLLNYHSSQMTEQHAAARQEQHCAVL